MSNLCLINQTHGTISEGSRLKSHILDCDTEIILCGSKSISGGFGADVDDEEVFTYGLYAGFGAGFIEAQRWISVKEELPEDNQYLINNSKATILKGRKLGTIQTKKVLIKYRSGDIDTATRCKCNGDSYYWWSAIESFDTNNPSSITHWRPIERV